MNPLIVGSNLTDLGRNSLAAAQMEQNGSQATSNRLLQYLSEQNKNRQVNNDIAMRQRQADQQNALANAALMQQGHLADMQWNTPNATTTSQNSNQLAIAKFPWTMGMTPEQAAQNALAGEALKVQSTPYAIYAAGGPPPGNGPGGQAWAQLMIDAAQRKEKNDAALKAANATYLGTVDMWHPMDAMLPGDRNTKIANAVRAQLGGQMPEVNELIFDRQANGGKGGFISPDQAQPQTVNPFPSAAGMSRTNAVPTMPTPAPAPVTNQLLSVPNSGFSPIQNGRVVIQNGNRYMVSPDGGSGQYLGPAQ
jgi:hypothetical protein